MPANTRQHWKRKCDYAIKDMVNAQGLLAEAANTYEQDHKDIFDQFSAVILALDECKATVEKVRDRI